MIVYDLLLPIRAKLKDEAKKKWQNGEIIDAINEAIRVVSGELLEHKKRISIASISGISDYSLPLDFISSISVKGEDGRYEIKSFDWMDDHEEILEKDKRYVVFTDDSLTLYPAPAFSGTDIRLSYNYFTPVQREKDVVHVRQTAKLALIYYAVHLCHQVPTSKDSRSKSKDFLDLYTIALEDEKRRRRKHRNGGRLKTTYNRI